MLIIICGLPGSGKSTLARALARRLGAVHLSSDRIRKRLFPKPAYTEEEKARVYEEMAALCAKALGEGKGVVADATFYRKKQREAYAAMAARAGTRARVVLCTLPQEEAQRRLRRRKKGGPSDADYAVYLRLKEAFERIEGPHLVVDSMLPMRRRLELVNGFLGEAHG